MRILLTTIRLVHRGGSELYLADVARALRDRGHLPVAHSAQLGPVAEEIRRCGIPVVDDLRRLGEPPDVIHGQHHLATMAALATFPRTPAVYVCHGWLPWEETPPRHPAIRRWVAVSGLTRERLIAEAGVPPARVHVLPNFVDLARFAPRPPLPERPHRALLYGNSAPHGGWTDVLRAVCADHGVALDVLGLTAGHPIVDPERRLPGYDVVFARGRAALEAMAVGCAVVLCDVEGVGPMVTVEALPRLRDGNFGMQVLRAAHGADVFAAALAAYDPAEAGRVSAAVRASAGVDAVADALVALYAVARDEGVPADGDAGTALADYLAWVARSFPTPRVEERDAVRTARAEAERTARDDLAAAAVGAAAERAALARAQHDAETRAAALAVERDAAVERAAAARVALDHLRAGVAVRVLAPALWQARSHLAPEGSRRFRLYARSRSLLGRLRRAPSDAVARHPPGDGADLACVVLAVGAPPSLADAVRSLAAQRPRPEIVVVASGGFAAETALGAELAAHGATLVSCDRRLLPGAARRVGIAATTAPWVAFLAADCVAEPGWVAGRLGAHRAGADVVASAVTNPRPWNPFATAAHVLLFSARLPGTPPTLRRYYGASYARGLFAHHGSFRPDLRTAEDTELHERLPTATRVYCDDVRTAHRNPTTLAGLLRDQHARGRRMAHARGPSARGLVARDAITRVPRSLALTLRATPLRAWPRLLWALPWLLPGAAAYARGAATAADRPAAAPVPTPRRRLVCVVAFHDERRFLADFLVNVAPHVDGIVALDDGSGDGAGALLAAHPAVLEVLRVAPRTPHVWNERRNRRLLVDAAGRHGAEWILALDADERLERDFRARADAELARADAEGHHAYTLALRELWDAPDRVRVDGIWGQKRIARLFRHRDDHDVGAMELHGQWAPAASRGANGWEPADLLLYHLRMIAPADREQRRRRYETLDPERRWQAIGYDYLTDERGLVLEPLPPGRDYVPPGPGAVRGPESDDPSGPARGVRRLAAVRKP